MSIQTLLLAEDLTMFLNQTYQYALRAMGGLAICDGTEPTSSKDLAEKTGVPSHYLSKIMRKMVESDYVISQKGHGGGFLLKKSPDTIRIIDVLNAVGFDMEGQPCVFGWDKCSNDKPCPMHPIWKNLKDCFRNWACHTSLSDIKDANNKAEMVQWHYEQ